MIALPTLLRVLRNYIGADRKTIPEFCAYVFSLLMKAPTTDEEEQLDESDNYYPFTTKKSESAAYHMMRGKRGIPVDVAKMVSAHFDKSKILSAIETMSYDTRCNLCAALKSEGVDCEAENVSEVCAELFNTYIKSALNESQPDSFGVIEKRNDIGEIIPPVPIAPVRYRDGKVYTGDTIIELSPFLKPLADSEDERQPYIDALMEVYSEKENRDINRDNTSTLKPPLRNHYSRQKAAFVDAYRLQRRVREAFSDGEEQFTILKDDTYECIEPVYYNDSYSNGYERLQAVLAQAVGNPSRKSALYNISGLIGALEQKGICHILVNDRVIKSWVKIYDESI